MSLGERLQTHSRPGWSPDRPGRRCATGACCVGSLIPVAVFGLVRAAGASVNTSGLAALWFTVGLLGLLGLLAAVRGGARGLELLAGDARLRPLGFGVVVLKIFIH